MFQFPSVTVLFAHIFPDISIKWNKLDFQSWSKNLSNDFALFPKNDCEDPFKIVNMVTVLDLMLRCFHHFTELKKKLEIRRVLLQSSSYNTITVQVISKSIRDLKSYKSLNIQNIARVKFKRQSFNVLQEKLNLANVRNNLIYQLFMYTDFRLQKS